jgi:ABC-type multidrug transport system ATPase subunit
MLVSKVFLSLLLLLLLRKIGSDTHSCIAAGIYETDIDRLVNAKIAEMGLTEYADRAAGTYSGGNKRKLSVAIAMIGEPSIVFLDGK